MRRFWSAPTVLGDVDFNLSNGWRIETVSVVDHPIHEAWKYDIVGPDGVFRCPEDPDNSWPLR